MAGHERRRRRAKGRGGMLRARDGRAGELAPALLVAVLLDHLPERHQVQRMQHLVLPLPLALQASMHALKIRIAGCHGMPKETECKQHLAHYHHPACRTCAILIQCTPYWVQYK